MFIFIIGFILGGYVGFMVVRIIRSLQAIKAAAIIMPPYSRAIKDATHHILILGDSSMYGVGATKPRYTLGGLLAAKYPKASIETIAFNGAKVKDLEAQFAQVSHKEYDLVVVGVGGNDIVQFTSYFKVRRELTTFLGRVSKVADQTVLCHSVNVGNIGFFLFPMNHIYSYRSRRFSQLYSAISSKFPKVINVIFYRPLHKDHYNKATRKEFISDDGFHASDYANQYFFKLVWKAIQKSNLL